MSKNAFVEEKTMMAAQEEYDYNYRRSNRSRINSHHEQKDDSHLPAFSREVLRQTPFRLLSQSKLHNLALPPEQSGSRHQEHTNWWECPEDLRSQNSFPMFRQPKVRPPLQRCLTLEQYKLWGKCPEQELQQASFPMFPHSLAQSSYSKNHSLLMPNDFFIEEPDSFPVLSPQQPPTNDLLIEEIVQDLWRVPVSDNSEEEQRNDDFEYTEESLRHAKGKPVQQLYTESVFWSGNGRQYCSSGQELWVPEDPQKSSITWIPKDVMIHALLYLSDSTLWNISRTCKLFKRAYFRQGGEGKTGSNRILFLASQGYRFPKLEKLKIWKLHFPTCNILVNEFYFPSLREVELANCLLPNFCTHSKVEKLRVSRRFHTDMLSFYPNIKRLTITGISNIELGAVAPLLPNMLQRLTLDVSVVKAGDCEILGKLTELELLSLWIGQNKDSRWDGQVVVKIPASLVKLRVIAITGVEKTPVIPPLPALENLTLQKINELVITDLPSVPFLKTLELYRCGMDFWDIHLFESKYPVLQLLLLCPYNDNMSLNLDLFPTLDYLKELSLSDVEIVLGETQNGYYHPKTPRLVRLKLDRVILPMPHLVNSLKHSDDIYQISFKSCYFRIPFKLPEFVGVKELVFKNCEMLWLGALASNPEVNEKLQSITITKCRIRETGLWKLNKFPNLVRLDLSENSLRTENIPYLPHLKQLTMVSCNLSEWDVGRLLTNFPALVALDLSKNKKLDKVIAKKHDSKSINCLRLRKMRCNET